MGMNTTCDCRYKNASRNLIRVVVVTPTRELASQVYNIALKLAKVDVFNNVNFSILKSHVH